MKTDWKKIPLLYQKDVVSACDRIAAMTKDVKALSQRFTAENQRRDARRKQMHLDDLTEELKDKQTK